METQWYINLVNENGDTIAEDYFTGTYEEAKEQAAWLSIFYDAEDYSIRDTNEI